MTYEEIKKHETINAYIRQADRSLVISRSKNISSVYHWIIDRSVRTNKEV